MKWLYWESLRQWATVTITEEKCTREKLSNLSPSLGCNMERLMASIQRYTKTCRQDILKIQSTYFSPKRSPCLSGGGLESTHLFKDLRCAVATWGWSWRWSSGYHSGTLAPGHPPKTQICPKRRLLSLGSEHQWAVGNNFTEKHFIYIQCNV